MNLNDKIQTLNETLQFGGDPKWDYLALLQVCALLIVIVSYNNAKTWQGEPMLFCNGKRQRWPQLSMIYFITNQDNFITSLQGQTVIIVKNAIKCTDTVTSRPSVKRS